MIINDSTGDGKKMNLQGTGIYDFISNKIFSNKLHNGEKHIP